MSVSYQAVVFLNGIDLSGNINIIAYNSTDNSFEGHRNVPITSCNDRITKLNCGYKDTTDIFYGMKAVYKNKSSEHSNCDVFDLFQATDTGDLYFQQIAVGKFSVKEEPKFVEQGKEVPRFSEEENVMLERSMLRTDHHQEMNNHRILPSQLMREPFDDFEQMGVGDVNVLRKGKVETETLERRMERNSGRLKKRVLEVLSYSKAISLRDLWRKVRDEKRKFFPIEKLREWMEKICAGEWKKKVKVRNKKHLTKQGLVPTKFSFMENVEEWQEKRKQDFAVQPLASLTPFQRMVLEQDFEYANNEVAGESEKKTEAELVEKLLGGEKVEEDPHAFVYYEMKERVPSRNLAKEIKDVNVRKRIVHAWTKFTSEGVSKDFERDVVSVGDPGSEEEQDQLYSFDEKDEESDLMESFERDQIVQSLPFQVSSVPFGPDDSPHLSPIEREDEQEMDLTGGFQDASMSFMGTPNKRTEESFSQMSQSRLSQSKKKPGVQLFTTNLSQSISQTPQSNSQINWDMPLIDSTPQLTPMISPRKRRKVRRRKSGF